MSLFVYPIFADLFEPSQHNVLGHVVWCVVCTTPWTIRRRQEDSADRSRAFSPSSAPPLSSEPLCSLRRITTGVRLPMSSRRSEVRADERLLLLVRSHRPFSSPARTDALVLDHYITLHSSDLTRLSSSLATTAQPTRNLSTRPSTVRDLVPRSLSRLTYSPNLSRSQ